MKQGFKNVAARDEDGTNKGDFVMFHKLFQIFKWFACSI